MKRTLLFGMLMTALLVKPLWAQEKVVIGGSGAITEEMELVVRAYKAKFPSEQVEVIAEPMSTTGGIEATKTGRVKIGMITRALKDDEKANLVYRRYARRIVGVAVHKSTTIDNVSDAQLCDIFTGKVKSWKELGANDSKIIVLARKQDDNNFNAIRDKLPCLKGPLASDAIYLVRGTEVMDALMNRPGTIGVISLGAQTVARPNLKALALSNVAPTADGVRSGKYKYFTEIGLVTQGEPKGAIKRFLDFAYGPEADKILENNQTVAVE
jgi:phosphate transport system substrate-binding protein